jgi:sulfonate transport system ATP-binding protein
VTREPPISLAGEGVRRSFGDRDVLRGVDIRVRQGEFVCLVGRSGAGKTVLLRILAGLDCDFIGATSASASIGVVFQDPRLLPWLRVGANVGLGLPASSSTAMKEVLTELGLAGRSQAWPRQLSVGEAQRVALARTLIRSPGVLLLDEPFSALDAFTRTEMQELLKGVVLRRRTAALLVTHDLDEALALADRVLVLHEGRISHDIPIVGEATDDDLADLRSNLFRWLNTQAGEGTTSSRRRWQGRALVERRRELRDIRPPSPSWADPS